MNSMVQIVALVYFKIAFYPTDCYYPTFYDSDSSHCVITCPSGTYGVVNRDVTVNYTRNCTTSEWRAVCGVV